MAEVGRFSQRISLEGLEEIKKGLEEIGLTGTKAFKEVDKAIAASNTQLTGFAAIAASAKAAFAGFGAGIAGVGTATARLGSAFATLGSTVGTLATRLTALSGIGVALSIGGATAAVIAFVKASAEAGEEVLETSQSLGLSVEAYQRLGFAAQQSGISQEQFARGISNLNKLIVEGANDQQKALLQFATSTKAGLGLAGQTVDDFRAKIGPTFQELTEAAKILQQQMEFRGVTGIPLSVITENLRKLATGSAEARKQYVALTSGLGAPLNLTALEKFGIATDTAGNALLRLGIRLTDVSGKARDPEEVLNDLAEAFIKIPNQTERAALALQLFTQRGRQFSNLLLEGRAGLEAFKNEFRGGFDRPGAEAADRLTDAFSSLFTTIRNTRNQLAVPLFGPLEDAAKTVQAVILANRAAFEELGRAISARVIPIINDFVSLISKEGFVERLEKGIIAFGSAVKGAITGVVIPAFLFLKSILDTVARAINSMFGTKLTGAELGIGILILAFTGLLGAITNVIIATGALSVALTGLARHPVILTLIALAGVIGLVVGTYQDLTKSADEYTKKAEAITKAHVDGKISAEEYNRQMRALEAGNTAAASAARDQTQKIAALTAQWQAGKISAQEYSRQLQELSRSTVAVATSSQNTGIAVREVGAAAQTTSIQVRAVGAATAQSTIAVREATTATQQATTQAAAGLATVEGEASDVSTAANTADTSLTRMSVISFNPITIALRELINLLTELARKGDEAKTSVGSIGGNIPGMESAPFARGGFVRGFGSSTSDSILARLSSGEFVIRAEAVRHWGASFFAALNALQTPRFDMGGLVNGINRTLARNFAVPGFAMGGAVGSSTSRGELRPVIINIGGRQVSGLFAPPDVVEELRRAAISESYLSAGRKTI